MLSASETTSSLEKRNRVPDPCGSMPQPDCASCWSVSSWSKLQGTATAVRMLGLVEHRGEALTGGFTHKCSLPLGRASHR